MRPPDDTKMPEEMRNRIMEQMPWLKDPNNAIPMVDPADIKSLWQQSKDFEAQPRAPGSMLMISHKAVACSPGADITSIVYRLGMLELAKTAMGLNFPLTLDGKPTDAVFKAFATIPMQGMPPGGSNTPRFDVFGLVKMILKRGRSLSHHSRRTDPCKHLTPRSAR